MNPIDDPAAYNSDRKEAHEKGLPALRRLADIADGDSGQARIVGQFLMGLYNGNRYPFDLTRLRGLDLELHRDCMAVLHMDYHPAREVHEYLEFGEGLFDQLCETAEGEQ